MITFNLSKMQKKANYDSGKGLVQKQTRACQNCEKYKLEQGVGAQEAKLSCLEEYQNANDGKWAAKYSSHPAEKK